MNDRQCRQQRGEQSGATSSSSRRAALRPRAAPPLPASSLRNVHDPRNRRLLPGLDRRCHLVHRAERRVVAHLCEDAVPSVRFVQVTVVLEVDEELGVPAICALCMQRGGWVWAVEARLLFFDALGCLTLTLAQESPGASASCLWHPGGCTYLAHPSARWPQSLSDLRS